MPIKRAGHRTKPAYIHTLLIKARTAVELCQQPDATLESRFERTLDRTLQRLRSTLSDENTDLLQDAVDAIIIEQTQLAKGEVEAEFSTSDCSKQVMKDHLRRYEIYAKRSR